MASSLLRSVGLLCGGRLRGPTRSYATNYKPKDRQQFADALNRLSSKDMILVMKLITHSYKLVDFKIVF